MALKNICSDGYTHTDASPGWWLLLLGSAMGMLDACRWAPSPLAAESADVLGRWGMLFRRLNCSELLAGHDEGGVPGCGAAAGAAAAEEEGGEEEEGWGEATGQPAR
jgi:hypothetical protein